MDFCHLIVTCLFSMLRLPFDNQKVKGNYAILFIKIDQNQSLKLTDMDNNFVYYYHQFV